MPLRHHRQFFAVIFTIISCMFSISVKFYSAIMVSPFLCPISRRCNDIKKNGQFNVKTMGSTANVGLMAQKAEEYAHFPNSPFAQ